MMVVGRDRLEQVVKRLHKIPEDRIQGWIQEVRGEVVDA
jgi:hypothetical protein